MKKRKMGEFPGGLVVRTPHFHYSGPGIKPLVGEMRSHKLHGKKKKRKKRDIFYIIEKHKYFLCLYYKKFFKKPLG